jgi:hypothetical protein
MKQTVFKGLHFSLLPIFKAHNIKGDKALHWKISVDDKAIYDLDDPVDHLDWNKVLGIKKEYFNPHYHSIMLAHRWNPFTSKHEWAYYIHDPKHGIIKPPEGEVFYTSEHTSTLTFNLYFSKYDKSRCYFYIYTEDKIYNSFVYESSAPLAGRWWETNLWFGGNRRAPSNYSITKKRIKL